MCSVLYLVCLALVTFVICDDPEDILKGFVLNPPKNYACFQIYNSTDKVDASTCRKPFQRRKISCALALKDDKNHCEIRTPSNESIIVQCYAAMRPSDPNDEYYGIEYIDRNKIGCYMVRKGEDVQEVCPTLIDKGTAAITTPDNYTLILKSHDCYSGKYLSTVVADRNFASKFTFDPNERSCYKLFTPEQDVSELTCLEDNERPKLCVHAWDKNPNCTVLTTPNNETVVIDCEGGTNTNKNCLSVHRDGNSTEVCMEDLSLGCVGLTTPSGLRLLFACRICRDAWITHSYDKVKLKQQRQFVKEVLDKGHYYKYKFEVWNVKYSTEFNSRQSIYPYWLPNTTCFGLKLDTEETILLQCTDRKFERKGCFKIIDPNKKVESDICAVVHEEECVAIETPKGKRVFLGCYNPLENRRKTFVNNTLTEYKKGNYAFQNSDDFNEMYRREANCHKERVPYTIGWLSKHKCWGIVTDDLEAITLKCPYDREKNQAGCFVIYSQKYDPGGEILPSSYKKDVACAEIINDNCVGITTPKGWIVQLDCYVHKRLFHELIKVKPKEPSDLF